MFQECHVEVDKESNRAVGQFQIRDNLRMVNRNERLDRLHFNDNYPADNDIEFEGPTDDTTAIKHRHISLGLDSHSPLLVCVTSTRIQPCIAPVSPVSPVLRWAPQSQNVTIQCEAP